MSKKGYRLVEGVILLVISLAGMVDATRLYSMTKNAPWLHKDAPGAAVFEGVVCSLLFLLGIVCLARSLSHFNSSSVLASFQVGRREWRERAMNFVKRKDTRAYTALFLSAILMPILGYGVATFVLLVAVMWITGFGLLKSCLAGGGMAVAFYLMFVKLANIPFPRGLWE